MSRVLLFLSLVGHSVHLRFQGILIAEIVMLQNLEVIIELIDQRGAGGDVDADDFLIAQVSKYLTRARRELPWAAMITRLPAAMSFLMTSLK